MPNTNGGQRLYGYKSSGTGYAHLGGAIIAERGIPTRFSFNSELPANHILPYDTTIPSPGNGGPRKDRAAVHLHGGLVPWASDGGPFHWQSSSTGGLQYGASNIPWLWDGGLDGGGAPNPNSMNRDYYYPNLESARFMWYHDHAVAQTRLNAYAGLATGYIVTDAAVEAGLETAFGITSGAPIVFQDKVFWDDLSDPLYSNYVPGAQRGDLWYPYTYDPAIWPIAKGGVAPVPSAVPEFFGDTMLANGVPYPKHNVPAGEYQRFRLLNACNGRFLDLSFVQEDPATPGEVLLTKKNGMPVRAIVDVWQIGTEGGYLPAPVPLVAAGVPSQPFILGPAERADILVRFKTPNSKVILYNVAGSPFPGGAPIFDWYIGNKNLPVQPLAGEGPNTRTIMRFDVGATIANPAVSIPATIPFASCIPTILDPINGGLQVDPARITGNFYTEPVGQKQYAYDPVPVDLTLNEVVEPIGFAGTGSNTGRLMALIGNTSAAAQLLLPFGPGGIEYTQPPTEFVNYNSLRIWRVFNLTADAHPMHFHLFNVQILGRQKMNKSFLMNNPAAPLAVGAALPPLPNEMGFKETVVMYPGEVTILAVLVDEPLPVSEGYGRNTIVQRFRLPLQAPQLR